MPTEPSASGKQFAKTQGRPGLKWLTIGLIAVGALVLSLNHLLAGNGSPGLNGAVQTHKVTRGDLVVTVTEAGVLESAKNLEIKNKVRGQSTITWVIENGSTVKAGDELVHLDTLVLEEAISERTKYSHWSRSSAERSAADVVRSELAISEYLEGRYSTQLRGLEKDLTIAQSNQLTAQNLLTHAQTMAQRGYISELDVEDRTHERRVSALNVDVIKERIRVLNEYTKAMELETLKGNLDEARARHAANLERAKLDEARRVQAVEELGYCVVKAERDGLVVYPTRERWKKQPEIEEGATVHKDQVLLLMPDLSQMQIEIGIHESLVERVKPGLTARITLPDKILDGEVASVAEVTAPAGWWEGTVVKYDTLVKLPSAPGLKPGMSAEVEVTLARYEQVLTLPVGAVLQTAQGNFCWVDTRAGQYERRRIQLGDSDEKSLIVEAGLAEGDDIVLDPLSCLAEAQAMALQPLDRSDRYAVSQGEADHVP